MWQFGSKDTFGILSANPLEALWRAPGLRVRQFDGSVILWAADAQAALSRFNLALAASCLDEMGRFSHLPKELYRIVIDLEDHILGACPAPSNEEYQTALRSVPIAKRAFGLQVSLQVLWFASGMAPRENPQSCLKLCWNQAHWVYDWLRKKGQTVEVTPTRHTLETMLMALKPAPKRRKAA